jgi:hypothetical protein
MVGEKKERKTKVMTVTRMLVVYSSTKGAHSGAREEKGLENGSRWRIVVAGEWQALEIGSRWRLVVAGEW